MELDDQSPEIIEYKAISGRFGEVRYFITTLDHNDAVENIRFAEDIQAEWSFAERVQRKLNKKRVREEIFRYLALGGIRFFNSIVVILLPISNDQKEFWDFSPVKSQGKILEKWVNLTLYKGVSRIVIDGQHRLQALKTYWNVHIGQENLTAAEQQESFNCEETFDIPVVYLLFGNLGRIGYADQSEAVRDEIIKATRNVFTVINKTAVSIDKQTQLLLDDSTISALIPRRLLEEGILDDSLVKWSSGSRSLSQSDPYLTTLDLLSQCTNELLRDHQKQALEKRFNSPSDREAALEKYYESHPYLLEIGTKEFFRWFFLELQPMKDWTSQLTHLKVEIPIQPESCKPTSTQKANLKNFRESSILYTILGQKILFSSIARFLLKQRSEYRIPATLEAVSQSVTRMQEQGFFNRNADHWSNVLVQPNEKLTMITKGSGTDRCIDLVKMILLNSSEGVQELIKKTREEVSNDVKWKKAWISECREKFHVILPEVKLIDEQIKESSESDDYFAELHNSLSAFDDNDSDDESGEIIDSVDVFEETEGVD